MKKQLIDGQETSDSVLYESFIYHGMSVFTTFLALNHQPILLKKHLERLRQHAEEIGLFYPGDKIFISDLKTEIILFASCVLYS